MQQVTVHSPAPAPMHLAPAISHELTVAELKRRHELIQTALKEVMIEGHHYGTIPGTEGKTLLKPGAEKICSLFMLAPSFSVQVRELANDHREYQVLCTLTHTVTGVMVAQADGSCSTRESKYRWRNASRKCPTCDVAAIRRSKQEYGGGFYCSDRHGGCGANFEKNDARITEQVQGRIENPDIADQYNTCLKIGCKRALVAAVHLATGASDVFAHEDEEEATEEGEKPKQQQVRRETRRTTPAKSEQPPTEMPPRQKLLQACVKMFEQLVNSGRTKDQLADLLNSLAGLKMPAKWGDLTDDELQQVRGLFEDELKQGTEVKDGGK